MLGTVQNSLLSLIFPLSCQTCPGPVESRSDGVACSDCWSSTRLFNGSEMLCGRCGAFFGDEAAPTPVYCHRCDDHFYRRAFALGVYEKALAAAVIHLKAEPLLPGRLKDRIRQLGEGGLFDAYDLVIPVPLAIHRRKERGFNQAAVIGASVTRAARIPIDEASLVRTVHTPMHRGGMDQKAREMTVKKAFKVVRPKLIAGKTILLVDDVLTSGSTASSCTDALRKSGSAEVDVFTLARAVLR